MVLRVAIVGPGRVGRALGRCLAASGVQLLGFVGRSPGSARAAVEFAGAGRELSGEDLVRAHAVVFSVGDGDLPAAIASAAAACPARPCSLWLHTSGRYDAGLFAAVAGVRRGVLHPVLPFPSAEHGAQHLAGAPAVLSGEPRSRRLLQRIALRLGMAPIWREGGHAVLYHAGCALAANGLSALFALAEQCLHAAGGIDEQGRREIVASLLRAALVACEEQGPVAALSGPVRRGDAATVAAHRAALRALTGPAHDAYLALMQQALELSRAAGLAEEHARAVAAQLLKLPVSPDQDPASA